MTIQRSTTGHSIQYNAQKPSESKKKLSDNFIMPMWITPNTKRVTTNGNTKSI